MNSTHLQCESGVVRCFRCLVEQNIRPVHGMIWRTRFFFMLAGRFPVLMFSFMMRTLVSF